MKPIPVILDTDIGSDIDDTWALAALVQSPELDLRLVTTTSGDTRYRALVAAKLLEAAGRADVPIGIGLFHGEAEDKHRHQGPWVEGYHLEDYPGRIFEDGVQAMIDVVGSQPEPVTVISIGPCFNFPEVFRRAPDFAAKCRFIGMHGSVDTGYGPGSPPEPETNVRLDVDGFRQVLHAPWQSLKITPLDTCGSFVIAGEAFQRLRRSPSPLVRACLENYDIWARRVDWMTVDFEHERTSVLFDNVAVAMAYTDAFFEYERIPLSVSDTGLTLRDPQGTPVDTAIRWRGLREFENHVTERLLHPLP